jgi:hypothetical protein
MTGETGRSQDRTTEPRGGGRLARLARVLTAAVIGIGLLGASATATLAYGTPLVCSSRAEAAVFSPWGDKATYFQVSNGGFENGSTNWALSGGATVVTGNEPYHIGGASDSHSLRLTAGSSAESRTFCLAIGEDGVRFMVKNLHVPGSILHVDAVAQNMDTGAKGYMAFDINGDVPSTRWSPSLRLSVPRMFGGTGTQSLTLFFSTRGAPATWNIDDVYIDPFKSW